MPPKEIKFRTYKNFCETDFLADLSRNLILYPRESIKSSYDLFESIFTSVLDRHAPWKTKIIRGNEKPHMNKALKKAIMTRSRIWNAYLKCRRFPDLATHAYKAYTAQRNIVTKMNKRIKKDHFSKAMQNANSSPKDFWKLCKPFMSNKGISDSRIVLQGPGDSFIQDDHEISEVLHSHFNNVTRPLNLFEWNADYSTTDNDRELTVVKAILKYEDHPSMIKIRSNYNADLNFKFKEIPVNEVYEMILKLDSSIIRRELGH